MEFLAHRINTAAELRGVPREFGVEVDLRDRGDRLILQHDPFVDGEDFESFLEGYQHGTLILNIKSERIEHRVMELVHKHQIERFFFLDSSFPMIYLLSREGERRSALRYSEFESLDTVLNMQGHAEWVWIDCFMRLPLDGKSYKALAKSGFKLCLVSPELHGREDDIETYVEHLIANEMELDAVCTKLHNVDKWRALAG